MHEDNYMKLFAVFREWRTLQEDTGGGVEEGEGPDEVDPTLRIGLQKSMQIQIWFIYTMTTMMAKTRKLGTTCQYTIHQNLLINWESQIVEGVEGEDQIFEGGDVGENQTKEEPRQAGILEGEVEAAVTLEVRIQTVVKIVTVDPEIE